MRLAISILITLSPTEEMKLARLAQAQGKDVAGYAHELVSAYLKLADETAASTFEEILSPIWEAWRRTGLTDDEVDDLLEEEFQAVRSERRDATGKA